MNSIKEYEILKTKVRRVGITFFVKYIEEVIFKFDYLKTNSNKKIYIEELMKRESKLSYSGISWRIYYMMNIIEMGHVPHALAFITTSKRLDLKTKIRAEEILKKIMNQ